MNLKSFSICISLLAVLCCSVHAATIAFTTTAISNASATIEATGIPVGPTSVNFYVNGQFFCNGIVAGVGGIANCSAIVPCVPTTGTYPISSQYLTGVTPSTGPSGTATINTDPSGTCTQPIVVIAGGATNVDALTTQTVDVTLGYNATNVVVMMGNSVFCTIPSVTADTLASCTAEVPCSAVGTCIPLFAFGTQADGEPTPYNTSGTGVTMLSINQVTACKPILVTCGCVTNNATTPITVAPGDVVNFALMLATSDSILNYQNLIITMSNGAGTLNIPLFQACTAPTLKCRMACCPEGPNSFLVYSWTVPPAYSSLGAVTITLTYSIVNNCAGSTIQGASSLPLQITTNDAFFLTLGATAAAGPDVPVDPDFCCTNKCCTPSPTNPFSSCCGTYAGGNCSCSSNGSSCACASCASSASGCSKCGPPYIPALGKCVSVPASSPCGTCCGNVPAVPARFTDWLARDIRCPTDYYALCQALTALLVKIQTLVTNGLNFSALDRSEDALKLAFGSDCETSAVRNLIKQIRYFEMHGAAIPILKSIIFAYQSAAEQTASLTSPCYSELIQQILIKGVATLNNMLKCGKILDALTKARAIYDDVQQLNPTFWTSTCLSNDVLAKVNALLIFEQSPTVTSLVTQAVRTVTAVTSCVCNHQDCCTTADPVVIPVSQPCNGDPLCQLRPFDTVTFTVTDGGMPGATYTITSLVLTLQSSPTPITFTPLDPLPANFPVTCCSATLYTWLIPCSLNNSGPGTVTLTYTVTYPDPTPGAAEPITLTETSTINLSIGYNGLCQTN